MKKKAQKEGITEKGKGWKGKRQEEKQERRKHQGNEKKKTIERKEQ